MKKEVFNRFLVLMIACILVLSAGIVIVSFEFNNQEQAYAATGVTLYCDNMQPNTSGSLDTEWGTWTWGGFDTMGYSAYVSTGAWVRFTRSKGEFSSVNAHFTIETGRTISSCTWSGAASKTDTNKSGSYNSSVMSGLNNDVDYVQFTIGASDGSTTCKLGEAPAFTVNMDATRPVYITEGTGIKQVYLSRTPFQFYAWDESKTKASGSYFAEGYYVYAYAKLADGYRAPTGGGWTLISGTANTENAIYEVGYTEDPVTKDNFGTINAEKNGYPVTITGGTGVQSVYLSKSSTATSGSSSGTEFDDGSTVYGFVVLSRGYKPQTGWTKVGGSDDVGGGKYRLATSKTVNSAAQSFGTINATLGSYSVSSTAGTGVSSIYYSNSANATSGSSTSFDYGSTVYAFAVLQSGYKHYKDWTLVSGTADAAGSKYRVASLVVDVSGNNFGTFNSSVTAVLKATGSSDVSLTVTNGEALPNLTSSQIPTRSGYTFQGFYSQENGAGKKYYDKEGHGVTTWDQSAASTNIYAYFSKNMSVTIGNYNANYDGEFHTISIIPSDPGSGYTIMYETTTPGVYDSTTAPTFKDVASEPRTVKFKITKALYTDYYGQGTVTISKAAPTYTTAPAAIEGLIYNNQDFELITAGVIPSGSGNIEYKVTSLDNSVSTDYSTSIPTGKNVTTYTVYYRTTGSDNYLPIAEATIQVEIAQVNKDALLAKINEVESHLDQISDKYPDIAAILSGHKDQIEADFYDEPNVTSAQVEDAIAALQGYLDAARSDVEIVKINAIGTVEYTQNCKDLIDDARAYYNSLDNEEQENLVTNYQALLDAEVRYNAVDAVVKLVDVIDGNEDVHDYKDAADLAKAAYDALTDDQKEIFPEDTLKVLLDSVAAGDTMVKIDAIAPLEYIYYCKDRIDAARSSYDALTEDQKNIVNERNYPILPHDEVVYEHVDNTSNLIRQIGEVEYTPECKARIDKARESYDNLTDEEKLLVHDDTLKNLTDAERIYRALELIETIGDVKYTEDSRIAIEEARAYYDSLSDDQKARIGDVSYSLLANAEEYYEKTDKNAGILTKVLLAAVSFFLLIALLLLVYLTYRYLKEKNNQQKRENANVAIIAPLLLLGANNHYLDPAFLALYILAALLLIVVIIDIVLFILKPKFKQAVLDFIKTGKLALGDEEENKEKAVEQKAEEVKEAQAAQPQKKESVKFVKEGGNIFQIRYINSFTAKLLQSSDQTKAYYTELKNEILSYKKQTSDRTSWNYESFNKGRKQLFKFVMKGKTLCVCYALNADDYQDTKYKIEKAETKRLENVPCLYRIKNGRRLAYAKDLIATLMEKEGLKKAEALNATYNLPYKDRETLLGEGLVKEVKVKVSKFQIRYERSFKAKLSQATEQTKQYYNELKNEFLSYKKVHNRISWPYESLNYGRTQIVKFAIRGKTLCVYYALNPDYFTDSQYKVEKVEAKKYSEVPCLYRIKNDRRFKYAKEMMAMVAKKYRIPKGENKHLDYTLPYETKEALMEKGLIKEVKSIK